MSGVIGICDTCQNEDVINPVTGNCPSCDSVLEQHFYQLEVEDE